MPYYLVMGTFGPAVDYLTIEKIREAVMGATHTASLVNQYLTQFGYTTADPQWILVPPAGSADAGTCGSTNPGSGGAGSGGVSTSSPAASGGTPTAGTAGTGGSAKGCRCDLGAAGRLGPQGGAGRIRRARGERRAAAAKRAARREAVALGR